MKDESNLEKEVCPGSDKLIISPAFTTQILCQDCGIWRSVIDSRIVKHKRDK